MHSVAEKVDCYVCIAVIANIDDVAGNINKQ
jgi:small basic protein